MLFIYCYVNCKLIMYIKHKCRRMLAKIIPKINPQVLRLRIRPHEANMYSTFDLNKSVEYEYFSHSHLLSKSTAVPIRVIL